MDERSDIELIVSAKSSDLQISRKAHLALWERYSYFIKKKYFQWISIFNKERVDFEDYMQEAYIAMAHAIEICDLDRMKEKNSNSFSTVLYFQLMKIKNRYEIQYNKYGEVLTCSDLVFENDEDSIEDKYHGNSLAAKWTSILSVDDETEKLNSMSERLVREYTGLLDPINQKICQLLIEREKTSNIINKLSSLISEDQVREKIKQVKLGLKSYVEENAYV